MRKLKRWVCGASALFGLLTVAALALNVNGDSDQDGMSDGYELFFGLNPTNAADSALDSDGDSLTNRQESVLWTDPLVADTDCDGFFDLDDFNPLSRAVLLLKEPRFAVGDTYNYTGPEWWDGAYKIGSLWTTNGWEAGAGLADNTGSLNISVLRSLLTSDAVLDIEFFDAENASLYAALCDTNRSVIVNDLYGNLIKGSGQVVTRRLVVPFSAYTNASLVRLWRGTGDVTIYGGMMYVDADGDGLDADQEQQLGTSDQNPDSDGDGLSDDAERMLVHSDPLQIDSDGDGLSDAEEVELGLNALTSDSDGDGLSDGFEVRGCRYMLVESALIWADARIAAEVAGGHLAVISTQAEQDAMIACVGVDPFRFNDVWIGAFPSEDGSWTWVTGEALTFDLWAAGQPVVTSNRQWPGYKKIKNTSDPLARLKWSSLWRTTGDAYLLEREELLDPLNPDMDGDGLLDGQEITLGCNPRLVDSDGDGLSDYAEYVGVSNPAKADTDDDGLNDKMEAEKGTDPLNPDSDGDGLVDGRESRFWLVRSARSWAEAKADAEWRGGHLAAVTSAMENAELVRSVGSSTLGSKTPWIGAIDEAGDGEWKWLTGEAFEYSCWHAGETVAQPENGAGNEHYALCGNEAGEWFDGAGEHVYVLEYAWSLDPLNPDSDGDGLLDGEELKIYGANPFSADSDDDGVNDAVEVAAGTKVYQVDSDKDGLLDGEEISGLTDPLNPDSDGDGLLDGVECRYVLVDRFVTWDEARQDAELRGGHLAILSSEGEYDDLIKHLTAKSVHGSAPWLGAKRGSEDGSWYWLSGELLPSIDWQDTVRLERWLTGEKCAYLGKHSGWYAEPSDALHRYLIEYDLPLDPMNPDTDGDGLSDYDEIKVYATNPFSADTDADGLTDVQELVGGLNPCRTDSDRDGLADAQEPELGLDPLNPDEDGDGLLDGEEIMITRTDPLMSDSNTNGVADLEILTSVRGVDTFDRFAEHYSTFWEEGESGALSLSHMYQHAEVTYVVNITNAGIYRLAFQTVFEPQDGELPLRDTYEPNLKLLVDGLGGDRLILNTSAGLPEYTGFTPWLSEGVHKFTCSVGGPCPQGRFTIESLQLATVDGIDADGNGIADWMERQLASRQDTDQDGVSDLNEVAVYGTDPLDADSDRDGLNDGDELTAGTDLLDADSDHDGVNDGAEVHESCTDPLFAEFDGSVTTVTSVMGTQTNAVAGTWEVEDGALVAKRRRGWVDYQINFPEQDLYRLTINAAHLWTKSTCTPIEPVDTSWLQIHVDGTYIGNYKLVSANGIDQDVSAFLPALPAGEHTVRVFWENTNRRLSLKINNLKLQTLGGADANGNGTKDWVESSIAAMAGVDLTQESYVSPACIEGPARYVPMMSIVDDASRFVAAEQSAGARWYANLPLVNGGQTEAVASFQHGALEVPFSVKWAPYNLLDHNGATLTIRKGDALRLTCIDPARADADREKARGGQFRLNVSGAQYESSKTRPMVVVFDQAGTVNVNGTYFKGNQSISAAINVQVIDGSFPEENPACLVGREREWSFEGMPADAVYEVDDTVEISRIESSLTTNGQQQITVSLKADETNGDHVMLARLYPAGPILDSTKLEAFWVQNAVDGYFWTVERYEDSELWEVNMVSKNLPDSVAVQIKVIAAEVLLDDYALERWVTNVDLDQNGEYNFRLFHPNSRDGSTCHTVKLYQGDQFVGEAFSGGFNDIEVE